MAYSIDRDFLVDTLRGLVRIDSVNPGLVPEGAGERAIAEYIGDILRSCSLEPEITEIEPGRFNVVACMKGSGGGRSLMLTGHMDTVGVEGMDDPFSAEVRDGKVYGRGAQDMKGGLAGILAAIKTIVDNGIRLKGDLIFAAVADEEYGSIGTEALVQRHKPDAAIVAEPTGLDVCLAHKGFSVFEFKTKGRMAHGGRYQDGIDANLHMGRILSELDRLSQSLMKGEKHPLLGPPSLHVPLIKGGSELFVYSDRCTISVERRTLPGEDPHVLLGEMEDIVSRLSKEDDAFYGRVTLVMHRHAYEISQDADFVKLVAEITSQVLGKPPTFIGHDWWEDSALIAEGGTETVIIGPRGAGLHTHDEWVDIQSVVDLATILLQTAIRFCS